MEKKWPWPALTLSCQILSCYIIPEKLLKVLLQKQEGSKTAQELCDQAPQKLGLRLLTAHTVNYSKVAENSETTFRQFKHK